jgi:hypothetical protein
LCIYRADAMMAGKEMGGGQCPPWWLWRNSFRTVIEKCRSSTSLVALLWQEGVRKITVVDVFLWCIEQLSCWCLYCKLARALSSSVSTDWLHVVFMDLARLVLNFQWFSNYFLVVA